MAIDFKSIQKTIGYEFENIDLLQQAFVRRSYSEEKGGQNNEVLEFVGDKALDLAVIQIMMDRFGEITTNKDWNEFKLRNPKYFTTRLDEGDFTDIKKDLVEGNYLAMAMRQLGFHTQLIMGKGDNENNIQDVPSVQEDLFEAIIGAVAIDSHFDMKSIVETVENMIDFDSYFNNEFYNKDYVAEIQHCCQLNFKHLPSYEIIYNDFQKNYECHLIIYGQYGDSLFETYGCAKSKHDSRFIAAEKAYTALKEEGYIFDPIEEALGNFKEEESLKKLNELVQKKLIEKPHINSNGECYDKNGNQYWNVTLISDEGECYYASAYKKKEAEREATYKYLLDLIGEYDGN